MAEFNKRSSKTKRKDLLELISKLSIEKDYTNRSMLKRKIKAKRNEISLSRNDNSSYDLW